ncbi:MAG: thiamine pyrophosphate-binding protein, partial [Candidatus Bathyarchaeota archaeon]|nr:thiamine pyrophosphate-binding protein [Candidatus Bathyarchaeota archaeon]
MDELIVEDAAHGYVEMLHRLGVDYVFSSPGSEYIPLWEHLARYNAADKKPVYINTRHEGTALSMAKGYYMATGKPQALLTHVITGLLHGAMELKAAYTDQIPLLMFVGQNRTHDNEVHGGTPGPHYLSFTEVGGQERLVQPYVKWADSPETNANILDIIQRAYRIANSEVKGPVLLNLSRELLFEQVTKMKMPEPLPEENRLTADPETIEKLKDMI